ncbi:nucleotidyl transferase AbiEii/AbiGii toxin family protein [Aquisphaera giovannonii]|uniref:nucleotidyl transferase AbiEii/AbiGii toxin family protein n=1 Tax=Aquisphaera giovannonii TaxID=406548 RepID=UPI001AF0286E|nr:nucleotidyl transferase AbiEii/AbiGii toxin family protein [Aquisphaera giovannonii]
MSAVESLATAFDARSVRYALIGGLALGLRGRPRFTRDVDFLLEIPQVVLPGLLEDLKERGFEIDPTEVIRQYTQEHLTSFPFGHVRVDWLRPVLPLYSRVLADATPLAWTEGHSVRVANAEGLILTKMVAFRPQDLVDIEVLLTANRDEIDIDLIREQWAAFAASEPERTDWLEAAIARRVLLRE